LLLCSTEMTVSLLMEESKRRMLNVEFRM